MVAFEFFSLQGEELNQTQHAQWMVDFLLPNGIMITHTVSKEARLSLIKEELWRKAQEYPLHAKLKGMTSYYFSCINQMAERVHLEDESKRLCDVGLFQPMLKLEENKKDNENNKFRSVISSLIGKGVHEFDALKSVEVSNFREDKKKMCERIAKERDSLPWAERVLCLYPPDVIDDPDLPEYLRAKLNDEEEIKIKVSCENNSAKFTFSMPYHNTADQILPRILSKLSNKLRSPSSSADSYRLKVLGRQEYLLADCPIFRYSYIRRCLASETVAELVLVLKSSILEGDPPKVPMRSLSQQPSPMLPPPVRSSNSLPQTKSLWSFDTDEKFQILLQSSSNVSLPNFSKVVIRGCLYHGLEPTGGVVNSTEIMIQDGFAEWNSTMVFDLPVVDLPRMARLCFLLYVASDKRKEKKPATLGGTRVIKEGKVELRPIAWVNVPVFDFQGKLHTGQQTLYMWLLTDDDCLSDTALNPIGTVECNPDTEVAVQLRFEFSKYNTEKPIIFPPIETVLEVAAKNTKEIKPVTNVKALYSDDMGAQGRGMINSTLFTADDKLKEHLRQYVDKDPLFDLTENDKEVIWKLRLECLEYFPHSLPRVLSCVQWDDHIQVALMQALLQIWRYLPPEVALELLDSRYPDKEVRKFAVQCLRTLSDSELVLYLLQLVQVLKYEPYLECELVNFLLEKAINNQIIGHYMFWMLRSEMYVSSVSVRFGLILEAYCYGNKHHLKGLTKQVEALKKLRLINDSVKHMSNWDGLTELIQAQETEKMEMSHRISTLDPVIRQKEFKKLRAKHELEVSELAQSPTLSMDQEKVNKEKRTKDYVLEEVKKLLSKNLFMDSLSNVNCLLDPARTLERPLVDKCRVMDSKMKPMWMVWSNEDSMEMQYILFKKGDDLRQDMLTLQILRIMDNIWKKEGLDLRLNAYQCMATGQYEGMIGVVTEAKTIAHIQKKYSGTDKWRSAFSKTCLYEWLKEKNPDNLDKALEEFTLSCAGYCVATYVLGIGDRHSDNILLRENGQLVHIDFGHILGHFKSKMGFKRERVPFVLTADFVYLIQRGPKKNNTEFNKFKQLCEQAYMALRKRSHFLITLFMMMMNTGIPEISSLRDIEFLRKTLVPHYTDNDARNHWSKQSSEALKNSFWAAVNFAFHNAARDNKQ